MSAEHTAATAPTRPEVLTQRDVRVLRFASGNALAMLTALGFAWEVSFLTPVLVNSLLGSTKPRPRLTEGLVFVGFVMVAALAAVLLSRHLLNYPAVFLLAMALILFRIFYAKECGAQPLLVMWLLITFTVIPIVAAVSPELALVVAAGLVVGAAATIALVWIAFALLPDPPAEVPEPPARPAASQPTPAQHMRNAAKSTLVVYPVFLLFHVTQWTSAILVLVYVALLAQQPSGAINAKAGRAMILGCTLGGLASILMYELLVIVPELGFLFLLTLFSGLAFGARLFSDRPSAPVYGMAFSTLLLIVAMTTSSSGDAGAEVLSRIAQTLLAVVYVVLAFTVIERFPRPRHV